MILEDLGNNSGRHIISQDSASPNSSQYVEEFPKSVTSQKIKSMVVDGSD
jgi:hypothetical protein